MCKEMPVIPVNKVVDLEKIIGKMEEERHKGLLTKKVVSIRKTVRLLHE
jgi:hypothetical protein